MDNPLCFIRTSLDALLILQGAKHGVVKALEDRPKQPKLAKHVRSGTVLTYTEGEATGILRWTDHLKWSQSRSIHNFFCYAEYLRPGEKQSSKAKSRSTRITMSSDASALESDLMGALHSLTSEVLYKEGGLIKRTFSVPWLGLHIVNYVDPDDVRRGLLERPSTMPLFDHLRQKSLFDPDLLIDTNYRHPLRIATDANGMLVDAGFGELDDQEGSETESQADEGEDESDSDMDDSLSSVSSPPPAYDQSYEDYDTSMSSSASSASTYGSPGSSDSHTSPFSFSSSPSPPLSSSFPPDYQYQHDHNPHAPHPTAFHFGPETLSYSQFHPYYMEPLSSYDEMVNFDPVTTFAPSFNMHPSMVSDFDLDQYHFDPVGCNDYIGGEGMYLDRHYPTDIPF